MLKKAKRYVLSDSDSDSDLLLDTSSDDDDETVEVNGFHVLVSQVSQVEEMFNKPPDLSLNFNVKIKQLKSAYVEIKNWAKSVSRLFERHPEIASDFRPKNPNLRTVYMGLLLSLIETMCQLPQEISKDDLFDAYAALGSIRDAGFKLDWLEKKLDEVSEKKENEGASETGLHEMEEELKDLKQKWSAMEALVEKEKAKVSPAKAPISFDDVV